MKILFSLTIACALTLSAQTQMTTPPPAPKPGIQVTPSASPSAAPINAAVAKPTPLTKLPADTVVATINGKNVTAGDLQVVLLSLRPEYLTKIEADRKEFVIQYGTLMRLVDLARQAKLADQSPYKEQIEYQTIMVLQHAAIEQHKRDLKVTAEDVKTYYDGNQDRYSQIKFKAIYLPFNTASASQPGADGKLLPTEADALAKAQDLVKQARAGADFVKLVKENSADAASVAKDGDFPPIGKSSIPPDIKKALGEAKPGDVTDPVRQAKGFYIFRIQDITVQPLEQVQASIAEELRGQQLNKWLDQFKKDVEVKMVEDAAPAPAATVPSASAVPPQK